MGLLFKHLQIKPPTPSSHLFTCPAMLFYAVLWCLSVSIGVGPGGAFSDGGSVSSLRKKLPEKCYLHCSCTAPDPLLPAVGGHFCLLFKDLCTHICFPVPSSHPLPYAVCTLQLFFYALAFEPTGPVVHMLFQLGLAVRNW
eukprot:1151493-Pelagomonas_calceolata.AAC.12